MGIFIFLIASVIEIAFAVFCIIKKSSQQKIRSIIRVLMFVSFALLIILDIIDWSFRYYTLTALLLLLAVIGAFGLVRKKEEKREYKSVRIVLKAIVMTLLIFLVTLPAIIFPQHKELAVTGKYQVSTATYTYIDKSRIETYTDTGENRKLNVGIWYPKDADGIYPLIVFSHGGFGIKTSNESLFNELASHGFVICSIDHLYQCFYTTDESGQMTFIDRSYMQELQEENALLDRQKSYEYYQKWMSIRTSDINFVIDYILAEVEQKDSESIYKLVDTKKIGVMGHSLGGSAALGVGRMRKDIKAVIALESPFMYDIVGVKDGEFVFTEEKYPLPVLNVYSDSGWRLLPEWPQYAENYSLLSGVNEAAFNVYIQGVGHLTLTDLALTSPFLTRILNGQISTSDTYYCLNTINKVCLEFFDCYLKEKGKFTSEGLY